MTARQLASLLRGVPPLKARCAACCVLLLCRIITIVETFLLSPPTTAMPTRADSRDSTRAVDSAIVTPTMHSPSCSRSSESYSSCVGHDRRFFSPRTRYAKRRRAGATTAKYAAQRLDPSSSSTGRAGPLCEQRYKVVSVWRYDEDGSDDAVIPWEALGDVLFEMGVYVVSIHCGRYDSKTSNGGQELETGLLFDGGNGGLSGKGRNSNSHGGDAVVEDTARGAMLTFTADGWRDVGAALEQACDLVDAGGCFALLDWDEGPVECYDSWEAATAADGFDTVYLQRLQISPVQRDERAPGGFQQIKLLEGQGWGNGEHPSTRMCLDFLEKTIQGAEEEVIDYGTGSGVLATAAALLGAKHVTGVDVDFEILAHAKQNFLVNSVADKVSAVHTREISIGDLSGEVVVVNMLAGPMRRLMPVLVLAVKAGGMLCLSGLRPSDVPVIKREYGKYMDWVDALEAARRSDSWGEWVRVVGRPKPGLTDGGELRRQLERDFSEVAVS